MVYVDDIKPGITSLGKFSLVGGGSALFEAASECVLHSDPKSGKVKFLAIGGWKPKGRDPGLTKENIPVPYVVLSQHLNIVGTKLCANYWDTQALNGKNLNETIHWIIARQLTK